MRIALIILCCAAPAFASVDKAAQARVEASLPAGLAVVALELPRSLAKANGDVSVNWTTPPHTGWMSVQVQVGSKKGYARVRLANVRSVAVARRPLLKGSRVGAADVAIEARGVADGEGLETLPVGAEVVRDIPAGELVRDADVSRPAPLARGTKVTVIVRRGGISVSTAGTIERPARPGDETQVRLAAGRLMTGRLIDSATVEGEVR